MSARLLPTPLLRTCEGCAQAFLQTRLHQRHREQRFCTALCGVRALHPPPAWKVQRSCAWCQVRFMPSKPAQCFCERACAGKAKRRAPVQPAVPA